MTQPAYLRARALAAKLIPKYRNDTPIVHQRKQRTDDGYGGHIEAWQDVQKFTGPVLPADPKEVEAAMSMEYRVSHKVYAVFADIVTPAVQGDRLMFGGRIFEITGVPVNLAEADAAWIFYCEENAPT